MFMHINKWVFLLSLFCAIVYKGDIFFQLYFLYNHPLLTVHMMALSILSTIGQMFVYRMINHFKQHMVPFVITTRKIFTVLISILFFRHETTGWQYLGIAIVFFTVTVEFFV